MPFFVRFLFNANCICAVNIILNLFEMGICFKPQRAFPAESLSFPTKESNQRKVAPKIVS